MRSQSPSGQPVRVREIPIIRESSNSPRGSPQSGKMWGFPTDDHQPQAPPTSRHGVPQHVGRSDGQSQWQGRVVSPNPQNRQVPIFTQERSYSPSFQQTAGYRSSPQPQSVPGYQSPPQTYQQAQQQQPAASPPASAASPTPRYTSTKQVPIMTRDQPQQQPQPQAAQPSGTAQPQAAATADGGNNQQQQSAAPAKESADKNHLGPPENQQPQPHQRSPSPQPKMTPLEVVQNILAEAESVRRMADDFTGTSRNKEYLYMEEMLTRLLEKLDNIDSEGKDEIRQVRRQGVKTVQAAIDQLELKVFANSIDIPAEVMDVDQSKQEQYNAQSQNTQAPADSSSQQGRQEPMDTNSKSKSTDPSRVNEMMLDSEVKC
eukprot:GHVT01023535.1.p1 GENE.GHVT01023535.1~~GHVT01023535.1.p1  ORF type:complete len:374 (+),score=27.26 GHVT01023535.1:227-1348(+)